MKKSAIDRPVPESDQQIIDRIVSFNRSRLPEMISYKYSFMADNAFRFMRGTCHLFYEQLSRNKTLRPSPLTWICGDLHLENFGSFKANNGLVYFDLNDFDEALLAPASWELIRIVTSILVAFKTLQIDQDKATNMAELFLRSYAVTLQQGKALYIEPRTARGIITDFLKRAEKQSQNHIIRKHTTAAKEGLKINLHRPKYFKLEKGLKKEVMDHISEWLSTNSDGPYNYHVKDAAFRLAGTGSVGLKRFVILLKSSNSFGEKHLLIDMKQAVASSLSPFVQVSQPEWNSDAERIVSIQKRMQNMPPALLSTSFFQGEHYIIQEKQPVKDSINFELIKHRYRDIYQVIDGMGMLTASSQLRSSGRQGSATADELIAFATEPDWAAEILTVAANLAELVNTYYGIFKAFYDTTIF